MTTDILQASRLLFVGQGTNPLEVGIQRNSFKTFYFFYMFKPDGGLPD